MTSASIRGTFIPAELTDPDEIMDVAWKLAVKAHKGQTRRDGVTPYIKHIEAVMMRAQAECICLSPRHRAIEVAVAALHDSVEDGGITLTDILNAGLPWEAFDGVRTLTRLHDETYDAFIIRIRDHRDGKWRPAKGRDIRANLADSPTPKQIAKYRTALAVLGEPYIPPFAV